MHVKLTETKVQIYDAESGAFLATHERCYSTDGMKPHLLPEHLTPEEKRTRLSPDQWVNPEFADLFYAYGVLDSGRFIGESSHLVGLGSNQASFYLRA